LTGVLDFFSKLSGIEIGFALYLLRTSANLVDSIGPLRIGALAMTLRATRIESISKQLIQHPSTTPRDHPWVNAFLRACVPA